MTVLNKMDFFWAASSDCTFLQIVYTTYTPLQTPTFWCAIDVLNQFKAEKN